MLPLVASAYDAYIDGIYYDFNTSTMEAEVTHGDTKYTASVIIPETLTHNDVTYSVTSISDKAFYECRSMASVTIPNSVKSIGECAFYSCSSLTSVTIPNSVKSIESYAFCDCLGLTSVAISNSVTSLRDYVFIGCTRLTSVTIPNSVKEIGNYAFSCCFDLTSITIPNSVTSIGEQAFSNCSILQDVYCYAETVPTTASDAFDYSPLSSATLHVPAASIEAYKAAEPWSKFGTIVALKEITGDLNGDLKIDIADAVIILNLMAEGKDDSAADLNGDDKVDIADFVSVLNLMAEQ